MDVVYHVAVVAFVVSALLVLLLPSLARRIGLVDRPGGRKSHVGEVPIVGGIAMLLGLLVALAFDPYLGSEGTVILVAAVLVAAAGVLDDRFDLSARSRLAVHLLAGVLLLFGTGFVVSDLGDLLGRGVISLSPLAGVFTVVAAVALINGFNMLDGLDGLAGGAGFWAFLGMTVLATHLGDPTAAVISAAMTGAIGAFLICNIPVRFSRRLLVFMGDGGSTLLGFIFAAVALMLIQTDRADVQPVLLLWFVPIPIFELFTTTFRRAIRGHSPLKADDGHFHHLLRKRGWSVGAICTVYLIVSAVSVGIGLLGHAAGLPDATLFLGFAAVYALWLAVFGSSWKVTVLLLGLLGAARAIAGD